MVQDSAKIKASNLLSLSMGIIIFIAGIFAISIFNWQMKIHAHEEAQEKAKILLDRNLATHSYYSHQLKPALFKKMEPFIGKKYFEPIWMSSTYAVREIDKYYQKLSESDYYYKEAAINARSPENEADDYEKSFIEGLNKSPDLIQESRVVNINNKPFFVTMRRGETMENNCLRCHSTPDNAPDDLVAQYGPDRSFQRYAGEIISAISIKIPLKEAYHNVNKLIIGLSALFGVVLIVIYLLSLYFGKKWVFSPLNKIRTKAMDISNNTEFLGEQITLPSYRELNDLTEAFNRMSLKLKKERDTLESKVHERTKELNGTNLKLTKEIDEHKMTIDKLGNALAEVKQLSGLLPICSHCKKIRDDKGYWNQIEGYIQEHSDAEFSHGICQECAEKFYPDMGLYDD
jgi:methyl-accepting chemotaxis protein